MLDDDDCVAYVFVCLCVCRYYYGTHGMPRDQTASYNWFRRAADTGNSVGQFAVGNLLRKGEGVAENATEALAWFRLAAAQNHTRSLNGLGSAYFHGHGVPQNYTKAFEYFVRAAELGEDGDSFFNAGALCVLLRCWEGLP